MPRSRYRLAPVVTGIVRAILLAAMLAVPLVQGAMQAGAMPPSHGSLAVTASAGHQDGADGVIHATADHHADCAGDAGSAPLAADHHQLDCGLCCLVVLGDGHISPNETGPGRTRGDRITDRPGRGLQPAVPPPRAA